MPIFRGPRIAPTSVTRVPAPGRSGLGAKDHEQSRNENQILKAACLKHVDCPVERGCACAADHAIAAEGSEAAGWLLRRQAKVIQIRRDSASAFLTVSRRHGRQVSPPVLKRPSKLQVNVHAQARRMLVVLGRCLTGNFDLFQNWMVPMLTILALFATAACGATYPKFRLPAPYRAGITACPPLIDYTVAPAAKVQRRL